MNKHQYLVDSFWEGSEMQSELKDDNETSQYTVPTIKEKRSENTNDIKQLIQHETKSIEQVYGQEEFYFTQSNLNKKQIEDELILLKDSIEGIEISKAMLIKRYLELKHTWDIDISRLGSQELRDRFSDLIHVEKIDDKLIKITLNFLLPHYAKNVHNKLKYYHLINTVYKFHLTKKILDANIPSFENEKVFVLITQYVKYHNM